METKETTDIYFASALIAMGAKLESVDRTDLRHMVFTLSLERLEGSLGQDLNEYYNFDELERNWLNRTGTMGAMYNMAEAIKRMKSVVHSK